MKQWRKGRNIVVKHPDGGVFIVTRKMMRELPQEHLNNLWKGFIRYTKRGK